MVEDKDFYGVLSALTEALKKNVELQKELDDLKHNGCGAQRRESSSQIDKIPSGYEQA